MLLCSGHATLNYTKDVKSISFQLPDKIRPALRESPFVRPFVHSFVLFTQISVSSSSIWFLMVPYGSLWFLVVPYGSLWFLMVPYGSLWVLMCTYGSLCFLMVPCGSLRFLKVPYGSLRFLKVISNLYLFILYRGSIENNLKGFRVTQGSLGYLKVPKSTVGFLEGLRFP